MKNSILNFIVLVFLFLSVHTTSKAQGPIGSCGTQELDILTERLLKNKEAVAQGFLNDRGANIYFAPLKWLLLAENDGSGRIQEKDVFEQVCQLNEMYSEFGMQFYLRDNAFQYLNNSIAFNDPASNSNYLQVFRENASINIYVAESATTGGGGGVTLAYYSPSRDWIVTRKDMVEQMVPNVIPHEVGHYFSLLHPFNGWDNDPWDPGRHGNPVTDATAPDGNVLNELVARTNCNNAGDFLCDTPADYNLGFGWSGCSQYNGGCRDANNEPLAPHQENTMGYFFQCGDYEFSPSQIDMIITDYLSFQRRHIRDDEFVPEGGEINGFVQTVAPLNFSTTDYFDEVTLEWTEVDGANRYYLEVAANPAFTFKAYNGFVRNNQITLRNLNPETTYYWRVKAVNDLNYCRPYTSNRSFTTPDQSVGINEIKSLTSWSVMPNPVKSGNILSLMIDLESSVDAGLQLISVNGQLVLDRKINLKSGEQMVEIPTGSISCGVYWLMITTDEGRAYERVVIQ